MDDGNQTNEENVKKPDQGNVIQVVKPEDGASYTEGTDGKDTILGTDGEDVIHGLAGDDYLQGGKGADKMYGGKGNDVYYVDDKCDKVVEESDSGDDTVRSWIDYTLPENVENLYLMGSGDLDGTGNELNNTVNGNSGDNSLYGLGGDDCLVGKDGNDRLDGGAGNDVLIGGKGNDTYFFDKGYGYDIIEDNGGKDTLSFGSDICAENVILRKEGDDLSITFANSTDSILVGDWFVGSDNQIENFTFSNGKTYAVSGYDTGSLVLAQIQEQAAAACV
ncbi:calcium-binding protein [Neisseria weixii]|uniref:calcium-binding protein n=1 Tax=Neisseria weixii TaxID=1853276 RepID=UPI001E594C69|nr:calcium-binding protein [Neisseria weixii]